MGWAGCHVKQQKSFEWSESSFERGAIDLGLPSLALWAGARPGIQVGRGTPSFSRWVKHFRCKQLFTLESCIPHPSGSLGTVPEELGFRRGVHPRDLVPHSFTPMNSLWKGMCWLSPVPSSVCQGWVESTRLRGSSFPGVLQTDPWPARSGVTEWEGHLLLWFLYRLLLHPNLL